MTIHMRPYAGAADLQRILDLKRACTTPENRYDAPTPSELRALLTPLPQGAAMERPPWEDEQESVIGHLYRRSMSQQATRLWEEAGDRLLAYALIGPPSTALTFQVHPQAHGSSLEAQILTWAITGASKEARENVLAVVPLSRERNGTPHAPGEGRFQAASSARPAPGSLACSSHASGSPAAGLCLAPWGAWRVTGAVPGAAPDRV